MTVADLIPALSGAAILAVVLLGHRTPRRPADKPAADDTRWLPFLPPVPPSRARDEDWLAVWPVDVDQPSIPLTWAERDRFEQIVGAA